ncbi:MAG: hypothetical protein KAW41_02105 [Candidatus Diapherotrites archaeon]|nr:hypothetical protein [Candidatus Diapherotrites archaeon]
MRKFAILLLCALLVGCVGTQPAEQENNITVTEDTELLAPELTPAGFVKSGDVTVKALFDEPVVLTEFKIDGLSQNVTRKDEKTYEVEKSFSDGTHNISVSAEDTAGNSVSKKVELTVDTAAPTVTVDPEDNEQTSDSEVEITVTFSEEVTIAEAKLNSDAITLSSSDGKVFTLTKSLDDAEHSLYIKARDKAGNEVVSDTKFTVSSASPDTTAPPQVGNVKATDTGAGGEVKLTWSTVDVNDFKEYHVFKFTEEITNVFGKTVAYYIKAKSTASWTIGGLDNDKRYCFAVTAMDNSGNEDYDVLPSCVKPTESDKTPPSITDESPDDTVYGTNKPVIKVVTNEAAACRYSLSSDSDKEFDEYGDLAYSMDRNADKTIHTRKHSALDNGTWYVYAMCKDLEDNVMGSTHEWDFDVEYAPEPNTAPSVTDVAIDPDLAYNLTDLTCDGTFSDADSDSELDSEFRWWNNDALIAGETSETLDSSNFVKDDEIRCEYTPCDGTDCGTPKNSSKLVISNSDPELSSDDVDPTTGSTTTTFNFTVVYTDDDNDAPGTIKLYLNSTAGENNYPLAAADSAAYSDGRTYFKALTLAAGNYTYWFTCSDGDGGTDETTQTGGPTVT